MQIIPTHTREREVVTQQQCAGLVIYLDDALAKAHCMRAVE